MGSMPLPDMGSGSLLLRSWDHGLVTQELVRRQIFPRRLGPEEIKKAQGLIVPNTSPDTQISKGTFSGSTKALTDVFARVENR